MTALGLVIQDVQFDDRKWLQFWENYKGLEHQARAVAQLGKHIREADPCLLNESAEWVTMWRGASAKPAQGGKNPLSVPFQSQLDNASGKGYRECFSSSAAMLAMFHKKVVGDDAYNAVRAKYGDTTSAQAQLSALRSLGLRAEFRTDGTILDLRKEIDASRPVAVGWLHKGPVSAPSGHGHWSVVIGYTEDQKAWIHNDPNGEASLVGGGYTNNRNGAGVVYSRKNWEPRWRPAGSGGWYLTCRP